MSLRETTGDTTTATMMEQMRQQVRSDIGRQGAIALNNSRTQKQRSAAAKIAGAAGIESRKKCRHPKQRREIACGFCARTLERMVDGEMARVEIRASNVEATSETLACVVARMNCKHPKARRRVICGFCRRPVATKVAR